MTKTIVTLCDLRKSPGGGKACYDHDPERLSQLLPGEKVIIEKEAADFVLVQAVQQPRFQNKEWVPYRGYIPKKCIGSYPHVTQRNLDPIDYAAAFEGTPYLWGGLSSGSSDGVMRGIDCSGLFHLAYRQNGLLFPRDSGDQFRLCSPRSLDELVPGDLLFLGPSDKIHHILQYLGSHKWIESAGYDHAGIVRIIGIEERIGAPLSPNLLNDPEFHLCKIDFFLNTRHRQ